MDKPITLKFLSFLNKEWGKNIAVAIVLLLFNMVFLRGLWLGGSLIGKDTLTFSLPYGEILHQALVGGQLPLWSHLLNFPSHAESQGAFLYPPNLFIYWIFDGASGYNLTIILHLLLMSWGMYLLARHHKLGRLGSLLAGIVFTYGAFIILKLNINNFFANGAWAPWVLLTVLLATEKPRAGSIAALAATTAMMLLTGHYQITSYTLIAAVIMAIFRIKKHIGWKGKAKATLALACGMVLGISIATPQLLPTLELASLSTRGSQDFSSLSNYSLFPPQILTLILPFLFGRAEHPSFWSVPTSNNYWGQGSFWELTLYFGAIALGLAIVMAFKRGWRLHGIIALVCLILAMGQYLPGYQFLTNLPPFSLFRIPARLGFITILMGSLLAGAGLSQLQSAPQLITRRVMWVFLCSLATMLTVLIIANLVGPTNIAQFAESKGLSQVGKAQRLQFLLGAIATSINPLRFNNLIPLVLVGLAGMVVWLLKRDKISSRFAVLVLFMAMAAELIRFGLNYNHSVYPSIYADKPPAAAFLQSQNAHRIYASGWGLRPGEENQGFAMLHPNSSALWDIGVAVPRGSLLPETSTRLLEYLDDAMTVPGDGSYPYREKISATQISDPRPLQMAGINYIVRLHLLEGKDISLTGSSDPACVYRLGNSSPPAYFVGEVETETDSSIAMDRAMKASWDLQKYALVDRPLGDLLPGQTSIERWQEEDNGIRAIVSTETRQLLVTDRLFYPGWQARLDDANTDIVLVNGWQIGVLIPSGEHSLELKFCYRNWSHGLIMAGLGLLVVVILLATALRRKDRKPA